MPSILEIREKFPMYSDVPDVQLVDALHQKFYSDIPKADFYKQTGIAGTASQIPGTITLPPTKAQPSFADRILGLPETAATIVSGGLSGLAGATAGIFGGKFGEGPNVKLAQKVTEAGTYQPSSLGAQANLESLGYLTSGIPGFTPVVGQAGQVAQGVNALATRVGPTAQRAVQTVQNALARAPEQQMAGGGAASTGTELMRVARNAELPVPLRMTPGQISRDTAALRREQELAKQEVGKPIRELYMDNNSKILQNIDTFLDETGAESPSLRATGKVVDKVLVDRVKAAKTQISDAYEKAKTAGELDQSVDIKPLRDWLSGYDAEIKTGNAPILANLKAKLDGLSPEGQPLTVKQIEELRKSSNRVAKSNPVNQAFMPEIGKQLDAVTDGLPGFDEYRKARRLHDNYATEFKNVGVIDDLLSKKPGTNDRRIAFEDVFNRAILQGSLDDVRHVRKTLTKQSAGADGVQAWKELQGETLKYIRDEITKGVTTNERGDTVVAAAQFNRAMKNLDDKLDFLFPKGGSEKLRTLMDASKDVLTLPPGAANTSGTASALIAMMDVVISGLGGVPAPIGSAMYHGKKAIQNRKLKKEVADIVSNERMNALVPQVSNQNQLRP
jgi:hypothetical protein